MKRKKMVFVAGAAALLLAGCAGNPFVAKEAQFYQQGVELVNADKDLEAAEFFKKVLRIHPDHPLVHYNLGVIYDDHGMFDEAIEEFRKALAINPKNSDARYRLGIACATQGQDQEAIAQLQGVIVAEPQHIPSHYNLGVLLEGMGQTDAAIESYRKVLEIQPNHAEALNNLGLAYARKGMWDVAGEQLQKAIDTKPGYFEALNNLGIVLVAQQRYAQAASAFQKARRENPKSAEPLYNLAKISLEHSRDYQAAAEYAQSYLGLAGPREDRQKRKEMESLLASANRELANLQTQASVSVESKIRKDAKEFMLAVQRADFRDFYDFQPAELRDTLTKQQWDEDLATMDPANLAEQKEALARLIGFGDLLGVDIKAVELVSAQKARVILFHRFTKEVRDREGDEKALYFQEVNGRWAPSDFLQRVQENWYRSKIDATQ